MEKAIRQKLRTLEHTEDIEILFAVESGSRAWGFASPDSDYDVRFVYCRPKSFYLKLEKTREVIELPIDEVYDINGWDLDKTLRLLYQSNPTLFEWMNSPIVYIKTEFYERFKKFVLKYFKAKPGLFHYLSMAQGNYREYLKGDMVKAKKYFYVLRPILACLSILDTGSPPPMRFQDLMEKELRQPLRPIVEDLLYRKMNSPEFEEIPKIPELNEYIEVSIQEIKQRIFTLPPAPPRSWEPLNELFLKIIKA